MRRLLATALLTLPLIAHAWGADGHKTVGTIAAELIKGSPAEARVAALLGDMPLPLAAVWADCVKGIAPELGYSYPAPGKYADCGPLETPARIAEMADYVRRNDRQCRRGMEDGACHRQTHYTDVALQRSGYRHGHTGTRGDDVVGSLRQAIRVLQGRPAPGQPRFGSEREALLVLAHLVGDLHQPLHVGAPYLDARGRRIDPDRRGFERASFTAGGNHLLIAGRGDKPMNLHTFWDAVPDALRPGRVDAAWLDEARRVAPDSGDPALWPARWAGESLQPAGAAFEGLVFSPKQGTQWTVGLPDSYEARAEAIKRQQLARAGARLARLLQALFPQ